MKSMKYIILISAVLLVFVFLVTLPGRKHEVDYSDAEVTTATASESEEAETSAVTTVAPADYEQFTLPGETPMPTTPPPAEPEIPVGTTAAESADAGSDTAPAETTAATTVTLGDDFMIDDGGGEWALYLVNNQNPVPDDFTVETKTVYTSYMEFKMDVKMADYMIQMIEDAKKDGISLMICSAYRSVEKQRNNFNAQVTEYESKGLTHDEAVAKTAESIAIPGYSEHHTGLCADIVTESYTNLDSGFENTDAFRWLNDNAWKYGFILRYPKDKQDITEIIYEPWHYRYVGTYHAKKIKESGLCLEEYITNSGE